MISINFKRLAYYLTPVTKRVFDGVVAFRVLWMQYVLNPLHSLMSVYEQVRIRQITEANVTGQVKLLQWHLNCLFDSELRRIRIYHRSDGGIYINNHDEPTPNYLLAYLESEGLGDTYVPLSTESLSATAAIFYIDVPSEVDLLMLSEIVDRYKAAGKLYQINTI